MADLAPWLDVVDGAPGFRVGRCEGCSRRHGPVRARCPWCAGGQVRPEHRARGTVLVATTTVLPVPGGAGLFHTIVLVELDPDVVVAGRYDAAPSGDTEPAPGTPVMVALSPLGDDAAPLTVHRFVPVDAEGAARA